MSHNVQWFTDTATPAPNLTAWYREDDGTLYPSRLVALAVQRLYSIDSHGYRISEEWLDTRSVYVDHDIDGHNPGEGILTAANNFVALLPADVDPHTHLAATSHE